MRSDDIKDIVEQLQRLQIRQDELLARLGYLAGGQDTGYTQAQTARIPASPARVARVPPDTSRDIVVGDRVRIRNPGRFQAVRGTVVKVNNTTNRATVQARDGSKIVRAPHNLIPDDD
jgi:transcription antitermination factor NusG